MGVSKNRGTPKSSILIGFSIINHPFWGGKHPYFWKHPNGKWPKSKVPWPKSTSTQALFHWAFGTPETICRSGPEISDMMAQENDTNQPWRKETWYWWQLTDQWEESPSLLKQNVTFMEKNATACPPYHPNSALCQVQVCCMRLNCTNIYKLHNFKRTQKGFDWPPYHFMSPLDFCMYVLAFLLTYAQLGILPGCN